MNYQTRSTDQSIAIGFINRNAEWRDLLVKAGKQSKAGHGCPASMRIIYAAGIIFFIRSFISCGDTSSTCVAMPHRCPNGS